MSKINPIILIYKNFIKYETIHSVNQNKIFIINNFFCFNFNIKRFFLRYKFFEKLIDSDMIEVGIKIFKRFNI